MALNNLFTMRKCDHDGQKSIRAWNWERAAKRGTFGESNMLNITSGKFARVNRVNRWLIFCWKWLFCCWSLCGAPRISLQWQGKLSEKGTEHGQTLRVRGHLFCSRYVDVWSRTWDWFVGRFEVEWAVTLNWNWDGNVILTRVMIFHSRGTF